MAKFLRFYVASARDLGWPWQVLSAATTVGPLAVAAVTSEHWLFWIAVSLGVLNLLQLLFARRLWAQYQHLDLQRECQQMADRLQSFVRAEKLEEPPPPPELGRRSVIRDAIQAQSGQPRDPVVVAHKEATARLDKHHTGVRKRYLQNHCVDALHVYDKAVAANLIRQFNDLRDSIADPTEHVLPILPKLFEEFARGARDRTGRAGL
jgi:hypothetical protein